jgi:HAMP domain-containing protein
VVIFAPARRRLRALEEAAEQFGAGDLDARAPERGRDESPEWPARSTAWRAS